MSSIVVATPPAAEPVSLTILKGHLRVTISDDDALIGLYLRSARELVEAESGRSLVNKLYVQSHDRFPCREEWQLGSGYTYRAPRYSHHPFDERLDLKLLRCPLVSVQKIVYTDTAGEVQTLVPAPAAWQLETDYEIGDQVADSNGNLQRVTAAGEEEDGGESESGSTAPTWNASPSGTTTDGDLTWTNQGTASAGDFLVDANSEPPRLRPPYSQLWPLTLRIPNAVQVYFTAGYGNDAASAPATLIVALMQTVGVSYEYREAVTPDALRTMDWYERLIWSQRVTDWNPTR